MCRRSRRLNARRHPTEHVARTISLTSFTPRARPAYLRASRSSTTRLPACSNRCRGAQASVLTTRCSRSPRRRLTFPSWKSSCPWCPRAGRHRGYKNDWRRRRARASYQIVESERLASDAFYSEDVAGRRMVRRSALEDPLRRGGVVGRSCGPDPTTLRFALEHVRPHRDHRVVGRRQGGGRQASRDRAADRRDTVLCFGWHIPVGPNRSSG